MALSRPELFESIEESTFRRIKTKGFLTRVDINDIWSDARRRRFISLNIFGFPEDESKATQTSFLEMRLKIVLILINIHWLKWHHRLINTHKDTDLPLTEQDLGFLRTRLKEDFQNCQWQWFPPIIKERQRIQIFDGRINLPFDRELRRTIGSGMSGRNSVFEESIPAGYFKDCNKNLNATPKVVARKVFKNTDYLTEIRETEIENLSKFKKSRDLHVSIMNSLAFLSVGTDSEEEFSIIMDLADTDLEKFLPYRTDTSPGTFSLRDLLSEAAELAGALEWLHRRIQIDGEDLACCHMDLKPSNVLIFDTRSKPVGQWKIADFGLSAIRTPKEKIREDNDTRNPNNKTVTIVTTAKRYPGPYTAPEVCHDGNEVGRNSDVWSYGCMLVDIIASRMTGKASLRELTKGRGKGERSSASNDWFYRDQALNSEIQAWIIALDTSLHLEDPTERAALPECKELLERILVIEPNRPEASEIRVRLTEACKKIPPTEGSSTPVSIESESEDETPQSINFSVFEGSHQATQRSKLPLLDQGARAESMLLNEIRKWILAPGLDILWVDEPLANDMRVVSSFCSGLFYAAQNEGFPVTIYFCRRETGKDGARKTKLEMLVDLTHSLIHQLLTHLKERSTPLQSVLRERIEALDGTATLTDEISVLADLWGAMKSHWFCIVDGFHVIEDDADATLVQHLRELLQVLCPPSKASTAGDLNRSKTLITTSGRSLLLGALPRESKLEANGNSGKPKVGANARPSNPKDLVYKVLRSATKDLRRCSES